MNDSRRPARAYVSGRWMAAIWSVCCFLALAVVSPGFLIAFDHHGAERIPTHAHLSSMSSSQAGHEHAYEQGHEHNDTILSDEATALAIARPESATVPSTSLPSSLAIPLTFGACALCEPEGMESTARSALADQAAFPPPTPPPTLLATIL